MINKAILIGRLGNRPEMRVYENGKKVAWFSLATSEYYRDKEGNLQEQTEWHRITCYGSLADFVYENLSKGKLIYIEGKIHYYKKDRNYTEIIARKVKILERKSQSKQPESEPEPEQKPEQELELELAEDIKEVEEDIPF